MSLFIDIDCIAEVLLADGWHKVSEKSFGLGCYEFHHQQKLVLRGGVAGVAATGAIWQEPDGTSVACPLTAVLAVRFREKAKKP